MLVLTRKPGQSIMIGDGIEVQVLSVAGEKVRLGITAPARRRDLPRRGLERIQEQEGAAQERDAQGNGSDRVDQSLERLSSQRSTKR